MIQSVYEDDDLNDYERQQDFASGNVKLQELTIEEGSELEDVGWTGPPGPDSADDTLLTPYEKPYRIEHWDREDLIMYVGGDKELYQ